MKRTRKVIEEKYQTCHDCKRQQKLFQNILPRLPQCFRRRRMLCTGGCLIAVAVLLAAYAIIIERNIAFSIIETITPCEDSDKDVVPKEFKVQTPMSTENKTAL